MKYAREFTSIPAALAANPDLLDAVRQLLDERRFAAKALQGGDRETRFAKILSDVVEGRTTISAASKETAQELPSTMSQHAGNNRVFGAGWAERLVKTELSYLYNEAVMLEIGPGGKCSVEHTSSEKGHRCASLAGMRLDAKPLLEELRRRRRGDISMKDEFPTFPDHPHCSHVVHPLGADLV